jgi:hypothetical protein
VNEEANPEGDVRIPRPTRLRHARIRPGERGDWCTFVWLATEHEAAELADLINEKLRASKPAAAP